MMSSLTYSAQQPTREWFREDGRLCSEDGEHEITQDPVYGYYRLTTQEDPTESISESLIEYELVLYAEALCVDEGCPQHGTIHQYVNS